MVKSFAHKIDGEWLQRPTSPKIRNASYRFNSEADPLYQKAVSGNHKTEAERRAEQSGESGQNSGGQQLLNNNPSKPTPVQKPRSQHGRHRDISKPWLKKQYEAVRKHAKRTTNPQKSPDNAPCQTRGPTQLI